MVMEIFSGASAIGFSVLLIEISKRGRQLCGSEIAKKGKRSRGMEYRIECGAHSGKKWGEFAARVRIGPGFYIDRRKIQLQGLYLSSNFI